MRVTWVHPSWRDLVIDDLAADAAHRRDFLATAELPGVLLALSGGGGASGERRLPLLVADEDWDALGGAVHRLCVELGPDELGTLLRALERALEQAADREARELLAIADMALATTRRHVGTWSVELLERWFALAGHFPERPEEPDVRPTWEALMPVVVELSDVESVRRLEAWLTLTVRLTEQIPGALPGLPASVRVLLLDFVRQVEDSALVLQPDVERALLLIAWMLRDEAVRIEVLLNRIGRPPQDVYPPELLAAPAPADRRRVRRILLDL